MSLDIPDEDRKPRSFHFSLPWEHGVTLDLYLSKMQIKRSDFIKDAVYAKLKEVGIEF